MLKMARTYISYLVGVLNRDSFTSQGEMFRDAQMIGFSGDQRVLVDAADRAVGRRKLESRRRGRGQSNRYKLA